MTEEKKDVTDQIVDGQGAEVQLTTEQGVESQVATDAEKPAAEKQVQDDQQIPLSRFNEVNERMKAAEQATQLARDQMALMQANQTQTQVQQPTSTYEQALRDCNLIGEDFLTQEQQIRVNARKEQLDAVKIQQQQGMIADQQFIQSHSDFGTVVGQPNLVTGQFMVSTELQKILMEKPHLRASCLTSDGAYKVVMDEREFAKLTATAQQRDTQQQIDNKLSPMSPAAAGGGAVDRTESGITEKSTAEDVAALQQRVEAGEFG